MSSWWRSRKNEPSGPGTAIASRFAGQVAFGKYNVDQNGEVATLLQIQSIPTVVLFGPDGSEITRISGSLNRRQLERLVAGELERASP